MHSLRAKNMLTCQLVMRAYMLKRQPALFAMVLTFQHALVLTYSRVHANVPCVLTYSRISFPCGLMYSRANMLLVTCFTWLACRRDHLPIWLACLISSFNVTFFSFIGIVIQVSYTVCKAILTI